MIKVSLLSVGNELLDGRVVDTNSNYIGSKLRSNGLSLDKILSCSDNIAEICSALKFLLSDGNCVIVSGGLGPTSDDLTRDAISQFLSVPLKEDKESLTHIASIFEKRGRVMSEINKRQALFPSGATIIRNPDGTAPGFLSIDLRNNKIIAALPGVPSELKAMFNDELWPKLKTQLNLKSQTFEEGLKIFGLTESSIGQSIEALKLNESLTICYRVLFPEIEVLVRGQDLSEVKSAKKLITEALDKKHVISQNPNVSLPEILLHELISSNKTISIAESCTGGIVASLLTDIPGSSKAFLGAGVTYSNDLKSRLLEVSKNSLANYGAVSEQVAKEMACGIQKLSASDYAVSITGIAGPDGGTEEKPVGTFFVGYVDKDGAFAQRFFYQSSRERVRRFAAFSALYAVWKKLRGFSQ